MIFFKLIELFRKKNKGKTLFYRLSKIFKVFFQANQSALFTI